MNSKNDYINALSAFISPQNNHLKYENFFSEVLNQFLDIQGEKPPKYEEISEKMWEIFDEVKEARRFNETYIGHMLSEACIPGMLGYLLSIRLGSNTVAREVSIQETKLEKEAIDGLIDIIGYDKNTASGTFTSGGSIACLTALAVARKKLFYEYTRQSLKRPEKIAVITTRLAHYSFLKSISLLGGIWEDDCQIKIAMLPHEGFKIPLDKLENTIIDLKNKNIPIMAIYAIAGETETGLVDPLDDIAEIALKHEIFTIADGAYGAPYKLSGIAGKHFVGLEKYDVVTLDGHKALYTPYSNGSVLFKNAEDHYLLNLGVRAAYINMGDGKNPNDLNNKEAIEKLRKGDDNLGSKRLEGSSGAGAILSTLAVLRLLGKEGLKAIYDYTIERTHYLYQRIEESSVFSNLHKPELNLLCFQLKNFSEIYKKYFNNDKDRYRVFVNETREELDKNIINDGGYFLSTTDLPIDYNIDSDYFLFEKNISQSYESLPACWRACIMHPRTSDEILDKAIGNLELLVETKLMDL